MRTYRRIEYTLGLLVREALELSRPTK